MRRRVFSWRNLAYTFVSMGLALALAMATVAFVAALGREHRAEARSAAQLAKINELTVQARENAAIIDDLRAKIGALIKQLGEVAPGVDPVVTDGPPLSTTTTTRTPSTTTTRPTPRPGPSQPSPAPTRPAPSPAPTSPPPSTPPPTPPSTPPSTLPGGLSCPKLLPVC